MMSFCRTGFRNRTARRIGLMTKLVAEITALVVFVRMASVDGPISFTRHFSDIVFGVWLGLMAYWIVGGMGLRLAWAVERHHPDPDLPAPWLDHERADSSR